MGVTDEHIRALAFYEGSALFDAREKAVIGFADQVTRASATVRDDRLAELRKHLSEDQIVELALVVCVANFTNRFNNGLRLEPDLG